MGWFTCHCTKEIMEPHRNRDGYFTLKLINTIDKPDRLIIKPHKIPKLNARSD